MAVDMYSERPLFGGAIASTFPVRFQDVSNVRQVPDHQEVFVDPARDESLIFELLELKQDVADNGSAAWFLQDLANEQDAEGTMLVEQSGVVEAPGLSFRTLPAIITTAVGQMVCISYLHVRKIGKGCRHFKLCMHLLSNSLFVCLFF
nr:ran guanine nucleotide release factor [Ipomoea batatas]GMD16942.1 ran guanine nucleotide release factor [Ipomoea batatas]